MLGHILATVGLIVGGMVLTFGSMFLNSYMWYLREAVYDDPTPAQLAQVRLGALVSIAGFLAGLIVLFLGSPVVALLVAAFGIFYVRFRRGVQPLLDEDRRTGIVSAWTPPSDDNGNG